MRNPPGLRSLSRRAAQLGVVALLATSSLVVGAGTAAAAAPVVNTITPSAGPTAGGPVDGVSIGGSGFTGSTTVTFGGTSATVNHSLSNNSTLVVTPPAHAAGAVNVVVTNSSGPTTKSDFYIYVVAPSVTGVSPSTGPEAGGTSVTITGADLTGATDVSFGGTPASYVVNNEAQITATSPAGTGTVDVVVTTPGGSATATGAFTYEAPTPAPSVTGVSPSTGPEAGGTDVTITGTNLTGATDVSFGGTPASYVVNNATQITATSPAGTGTVDVVVTTPGGSATATGAFTYEAPTPAPTVTGVSPSTGPEAGGTDVTITGTNLTGATDVTFGGAPATSFTVDSATQITAVSPPGTGTVDVTVTTPGGSSTATGGFAYEAPTPKVTGVSPSSGPEAGGTVVTITGRNFTGATAVTFGRTPAMSFIVDSATQITATSPGHVAGSVDVKVETPEGSDTAANAFTYVPGGGGGTAGSKQPQHITFTPPTGGTVGDTETLQATGGGSGNPVVFTVDPTSTPGACTVSGNTVTYTGVGSCVIDANQAGNADYDAAPQEQQTAPVTEPGAAGVTDPTITASVTSNHKKHHGWYRSPVTITFSCTVGSAPLTAPCRDSVTLRDNGKGQTVTRTVTATDGGKDTITVGPIKIDRRKPHLKVKGAHNGKVYAHGRHLTCVASDTLSGVQKCVIHKHHRNRGDVRRVNWSAKAKDKAGNVRRVHGHYFVRR